MAAYLFTIGLISLLGQVVILRELSAAFYGVELIYILSLGIWLLWTAAGALIGRHRQAPALKTIVALFVFTGFLFPLATAAIRAIRMLTGAVPGSYLPFSTQLTMTALCLLPSGVALGLLFQWSAKHFVVSRKDSKLPKTFASAYGLESGGAVAGGLISTCLLAWGVQNFSQALLCSLLTFPALFFSGAPFRRIARISIIGAMLAVSGTLWFSSEMDSRMTRWNHPDMVASADTPYGRVTITQRGGQFVVFENDAMVFETESTAAEEFVHLAAVHHPKPEKILVSGGGIEGIVGEVLKYAPVKVEYVELNEKFLKLVINSMPDSFFQFLKSERVSLHISDPGMFLKNTTEKYDLILSGMPEPSSGQSNRFYTQEYFRQCAQRLTHDGIFAFRLPSSENIWTSFMTQRNVGIYQALLVSFNDVLVLPGTTSIFIASVTNLSRDPEFLKTRFVERNIATDLFPPAYIEYLHTNDRFFVTRNILAETKAPPNTDMNPACYQYSTLIWLSKLIPRLTHKDISFINPHRLFLVLMVFFLLLGLVAAGFRIRQKVRTMRVIRVLVAAFIGMTAEIMLLLYFQVKHGILYQNLGALMTVFMLGMVAGAYQVQNNLTKRSGNLFQWSSKKLFLSFVLCHFIFIALAYFEIHQGFITISALLFGNGFVVAGVLAHESLKGIAEQKKVISPLYAADLAGGCAGAFLASFFLIPFMGMWFTAILLIMLAAMMAVRS